MERPTFYRDIDYSSDPSDYRPWVDPAKGRPPYEVDMERGLYLDFISEDQYTIERYLRWSKDIELRRYLSKFPETEEQVRTRFGWWNSNGWACFAIVLENPEDPGLVYQIGHLTLQRNLHTNVPVPAGMIIGEKLRDKGYGSAVAKHIPTVVASEYRWQRIVVFVHPDNKPSIRIFNKANFKPTGNIDDEGFIELEYMK